MCLIALYAQELRTAIGGGVNSTMGTACAGSPLPEGCPSMSGLMGGGGDSSIVTTQTIDVMTGTITSQALGFPL